jgi:hypothetical protein
MEKSKYFIKNLKYFIYSFIKSNMTDADSDSTSDSNRPSYMDKFECINKILLDLETKCNL